MLPTNLIYIIIQYSGVSYYKLAKWLEPFNLPFSEAQYLLKLYHDYKIKKAMLKYCVQFTIENKLCRVDGPAKIWNIGGSEYYYNGNKHRLDGPACQYKCNNIFTTEWYINGKLHRTDGPARIVTTENNVVMEYWNQATLHRLDGPAKESTDGKINEYWINGTYFSKDEFLRYRSIKCCVIV